MTKPRIIIEFNGLPIMDRLAARYKHNDWYKKLHGCNWKPLSGFQWIRHYITKTAEALKDVNADKAIGIFPDLPWEFPFSTYERKGLGKIPTVGLHMPAVNRIINIGKVCKEVGWNLVYPVLNDCSRRKRKWGMEYYSDYFWNRYHKPHIENITWEFKEAGIKDIIWAEFCNEGRGLSTWEKTGASFLKDILGYKIACSSPVYDYCFMFVLHENCFDFLTFHGIWLKDRWREYLALYKNNPKVIPSGDGFSDCWYPYSGSQWYQFGDRGYGKLPSAGQIARYLKECKTVGIDLNASGAIECREPRFGLVQGWLRKIAEAYAN